MLLNNITLVDRSNKPSVSQRVGLRTYFINNGQYQDPYEISSVQLFTKAATLSPLTVLGTENLVDKTPLMAYGAFGTNDDLVQTHCTFTSGGPEGSICEDAFDPTTYAPGVMASGIYRVGVGDYVVVLDQETPLLGWDYTTSTQVSAVSLSSVGEYVDIWTVKLTPASKYQVFINNFTLSEDTFFAFTEPLMLSTSNKLLNKDIRLGETIDLKVTTESTLQNKTLDQSLINIFKQAVVTNPSFAIRKVNYDDPVGGSVSAGSLTPSVTSDNTLIASWSTTGISTDVGSRYGTYSLQATYTLLNQTIVSPLFYFTVS